MEGDVNPTPPGRHGPLHRYRIFLAALLAMLLLALALLLVTEGRAFLEPFRYTLF